MNQRDMADLPPIENAESVIERFGGIRPMATKINVPVTTVQGWKKRNVIPGNRRDEIIKAAAQLGVDVSDIVVAAAPVLTGAKAAAVPAVPVANENDNKSFKKMVSDAPAKPQVEPYKAPPVLAAKLQASAPQTPAISAATLHTEISRAERRAVTKSTAINVLLILLVVGSIVLLLWPQSERRMASLEGDVRNLQTDQSVLSGLIPTNIEQKLAELQAKAAELQGGVTAALERAKHVSNDLVSPAAGSLEKRVEKLESHITDVTGLAPSAHLADLMSKFQSLRQNLDGEQQLNRAAMELSALVSGVSSDDPAVIDQSLQSAKMQNPDIAQTFQDVPPQDLKAAALLLGMTQFRSSLNRDNQPFENDLALLQKLVGVNDPELQASLERLAPYAKEGVLTPQGLSSEFRGLAGDVVVASLQGQDVSVQEKARARFGEMFQVEKNGEPISGTPTQNTLVKADKLLQAGDLEGAVQAVQTLDGPAAIAVQPWLTKAQATLMAQKFKNFLNHSINNRAYGTPMPVAGGGSGSLPGMSTLIQDDETGINILRP